MRLRAAVIAWAPAAFLAVSCSSLHPVAVNAGDQCSRCRRTIHETRLASEVIGGNGFVSKYRTPGCLATYVAQHPTETGTIFVTDYSTGKMVRADRAIFVPVLLNRDTGERDYRAYQLADEANAAALEAHSVSVDWKAVVEKARS
jgi:hypothetical protein